MKNAARIGDPGACPTHKTAMVASGHPHARANSLPMARAGDDCVCGGMVPSTVAGGSSTVRIHFVPCARVWPSSLAHGGRITGGSPNVFIGGPTSTMVGALSAYKACVALAAGRANGSPWQSFGDCGPESARMLINTLRAQLGLPPLSEEDMLGFGGFFGMEPGPDAAERGGMYPGDLAHMLAAYGIASEVGAMTPEQMEAAIAEGRPVIASVRPSEYWPESMLGTDRDGYHYATVFAVERDENGNIVAYWVNDTSAGCGIRVPADKFNRARADPDGSLLPTVTPKSPVHF